MSDSKATIKGTVTAVLTGPDGKVKEKCVSPSEPVRSE